MHEHAVPFAPVPGEDKPRGAHECASVPIAKIRDISLVASMWLGKDEIALSVDVVVEDGLVAGRSVADARAHVNAFLKDERSARRIGNRQQHAAHVLHREDELPLGRNGCDSDATEPAAVRFAFRPLAGIDDPLVAPVHQIVA